jgi:hypothetical protein
MGRIFSTFGFLMTGIAGAACASDTGDKGATDACELLAEVDIGMDLSEFNAFADGPNELGCRAAIQDSAEGARLVVHRRASEADAQQFFESYLSDPPNTDTFLSPAFAKLARGNLVLVLQTSSGDGLEQLVSALGRAAADRTLAFSSETVAVTTTPAALPEPLARVPSSLTLIVESQTVDEVCYRIESDAAVVADSSCFTGPVIRDGDPPVRNLSLLSIEGRDAALYAIGEGFEVYDVLAEPQDVQWGTAPAGWLLITFAPEVGSLRLVLASPDETLVCSPNVLRPSCEEAP